MKLNTKKVSVIVMSLMAAVLAAGTVFEKQHGAEWTGEHFYGSWWFALLMALVAVGAIVSIVRGKMWKRPAALLIHASVPVILLGGALTSWVGESGSVTLAPGETQMGVTLESFEVVYYPGTRTPMDFVSHVTVADGSLHEVAGHTTTVRKADISMNHILRHHGYRFYQEDYDDEGRTTLSYSHDPWGIAVTYCGYALLLLGLLWLLIARSGPFRRLLRGAVPVAFLLLFNFQFSIFNSAQAAPQTLPKATASKMGEMYVLYKGRICPLQTFAKDFTTKLTGKATYEGLSSEQVLGGFLFYYGDWAPLLDEVDAKRKKESEGLVEMLLSGRGLKLFPVADSTGALGWYAQNDALPVTVSEEEYIFIRKHLGYCQEQVVKGDFKELERVFDKIRLFQEKRAAEVLPTPTRVKAERLHNALTTGRWLPILSITLGILFFALALIKTSRHRDIETPRLRRKFSIFNFVSDNAPSSRQSSNKFGFALDLRSFQFSIVILLTSYLLLIFILRWIAGGHIPMAGGFDTMNLMAMVIGIVSILLAFPHKKFSILSSQFSISAGMLTMGFCLLVAMMSGSNPPVTNLMPVLSSPLLCLHVTVIMMSYALFFFMMMIGVAGLIAGRQAEMAARLHRLGMMLLYPGVFLLALGIIIGALWANISWGNYWSWDPKEVWALITLIVYAFPLHFNKNDNENHTRFHLYLTLAFLSVVITYFGVNLLLGGMHAYN